MGLLSKLKKAVHKIDPVAKATDKLRGKVHQAGNNLAVKATSATLGKKAGAKLAGALKAGDSAQGISSNTRRTSAPGVRPATGVNATGSAGARTGVGRLNQARGSFNKKGY